MSVNAAQDSTDLVSKLRAYHNSKIKSLKYATEAAITILRIDDMIKLDKEQKKGGHGDECM